MMNTHMTNPSAALRRRPPSSSLATRVAGALWLAAALAPAPAAAQGVEGSIAYTHSVEIRLEIPEEMRARLEAARAAGRLGELPFPDKRVEQVVLIFGERASLMKPVPPEESEERAAGPPTDADRGARMRVFLNRVRQMSANRADREKIVSVYTDFEGGRMVEVREFLGRTFRIEGERPTYQWKLTSEQAEYQGYLVQKAVAQQDSTTIEAWFTPQIPVMGGPGPYGGLPGMILVISVNDGTEQYSATSVALAEVADDVLAPPEDGDEVSREAYERIVEEKLEELRMMRRRRIR